MKIDDTNRNGYTIIKNDCGEFKLCKILNIYKEKEDCNKDLVALLTRKKTEKEILKEFSKKKIF